MDEFLIADLESSRGFEILMKGLDSFINKQAESLFDTSPSETWEENVAIIRGLRMAKYFMIDSVKEANNLVKEKELEYGK